MSAKCAWNTLQLCWIDTYLGPPDFVVHDAGKNFSSTEFKEHANLMAVEVKEVPVEAHNSVGKVERYHAPLRRAFLVIRDELQNEVTTDVILQMAVKAVNDTAGPDGIVPTLLVFGAYPRMTASSPPSPSILQRAEALRKATKEVRHLYAERQVKDALQMRNGLVVSSLKLPIQSDIRVWREKEGWTGPFKLIATDGKTCTVEMPYGPTNFRSTVVKPYSTNGHGTTLATTPVDDDERKDEQEDKEEDLVQQEPEQPPSVRRSHRPRRPKAHFDDVDFDDQFVTAIGAECDLSMIFMTSKEQADQDLALQLRKEGRITTAGQPPEASDNKEIESLIARGVFKFEMYNDAKHGNTRIFKSRIVNEIKGKATETPYEKSRLVIQGYLDNGKESILTQSPTIQRASQGVIVALAPSLAQPSIARLVI